MSPKHYVAAIGTMLAAFVLPARAETIQVTIDKLVFLPAAINAKVGDTVEWINKDPFAHTATVRGGWEVTIPPKKSGSIVLQ